MNRTKSVAREAVPVYSTEAAIVRELRTADPLRIAAARIVAATRREQGLAPRISDRGVVGRLATLVAAAQSGRGERV